MQREQVATWTVHTDVFDGPLDLLLYLVRRDGVDLRTLEVVKIADAYLEMIQHFRDLNLSVAGEYLVMAATLIHLKSLELLPRPPTPVDEEEIDPREAFAQHLRQYERYRAAADALSERGWLGRDHFARTPVAGRAPDLTTEIGPFGLLEIYRELVSAAEAPEPEVTFEDAGPDLSTVALRLLETLRRAGGRGELRGLLESLQRGRARVVTFISVLEMARLQWISLRQRSHLGAIELVVKVAVGEADPRALTGWVET